MTPIDIDLKFGSPSGYSLELDGETWELRVERLDRISVYAYLMGGYRRLNQEFDDTADAFKWCQENGKKVVDVDGSSPKILLDTDAARIIMMSRGSHGTLEKR